MLIGLITKYKEMFFQIVSTLFCAAAALPLVQKFLPAVLNLIVAKVPVEPIVQIAPLYAQLDAKQQIGVAFVTSLLYSPIVSVFTDLVGYLLFPVALLATMTVGLLTVGGTAQSATLSALSVCPWCTCLAEQYVHVVLPELNASKAASEESISNGQSTHEGTRSRESLLKKPE